MISNSQCKNPLQSWNGKLMSYQVWKNGFEGRPLSHNIHFRSNASHDRRRLFNSEREPKQKQRVILWGAHHKTGTFLAQKVFSVICARMKWCCVFHPTRDSIDAIHHVFSTEPVSIIGHNQWIWYPEEIAGDKDYIFVHFFRHPVRKIVSGYRYHREGAETWTTSPKPYTDVCSSNLHRLALQFMNTTAPKIVSGKSSLDSSSTPASQIPTRSDVVDHCKSVHLCVTCCRREHEKFDSIHSKRYASLPSDDLTGRPHSRAKSNTGGKILENGARREYMIRPATEYAYLCKHLGSAGTSLRDTLRSQSLAEGLATEAALHMYESLRMARIVNHTYHDPRSLNIDLDDLTRDALGFQANIWTLLKHLQLGLSDKELTSLSREIDFYNIKHSTLYKLSMSVPFLNNHIDTTLDSKDWGQVLSSQHDFQQAYKPVFQLMATV